MQPPHEESMHNEENAANVDGNGCVVDDGSVIDSEKTGMDMENGIEPTQGNGTDSTPCMGEANSIQVVESDDPSNQEIEVSPLRAAVERRKSQKEKEEASDGHKNSSNTEGEQNLEFLSIS